MTSIKKALFLVSLCVIPPVNCAEQTEGDESHSAAEVSSFGFIMAINFEDAVGFSKILSKLHSHTNTLGTFIIQSSSGAIRGTLTEVLNSKASTSQTFETMLTAVKTHDVQYPQDASSSAETE